MKKFLCRTVVVIMAVVFLAGGSSASAKDTTEITVNGTKVLRAPSSWKKVSWKCSNKNIRIIKKQGKKVTIKGVKKGNSTLTASCGTQKKSFQVKVKGKTKKKDQDCKKSVDISVQSAELSANKLSVTLHVKNDGTKDLKMGVDAKLYRFDDAKRNYVEVTNEAPVPDIIYLITAGKEQNVKFEFKSTGITSGRYKICVGDNGYGTDSQKTPGLSYETTESFEFSA